MKILFVSSTPFEYSSSANLRNIALMKGFIELGHSVSTLSAKPEVNSLYYDDSLVSINLENKYYLEISGLHSQFTSKKEKTNNFLNRIRKKVKYLAEKVYTSFFVYDPRKNLVSKVKNLSINETYDYIISSSDPKSSHLIVEELIKFNKGICNKWIQYWGDPFVNDINRKSKLPYKFVKYEEKRILNKASEVIYVSPFTLAEQSRIFPQINYKFRFLPIPYNKCIYYESQRDNETFRLGYFGDYYSNDRNIVPLYDVVKKNTDLVLNIFGYSDISLNNFSNISINPRTKYETIKKYEETSDLLVCICNKKGTQIPGKIYHYAATNKPILIILDGENSRELRGYFEKFDRYYICENNEKSIYDAIEYAKQSDRKYEPSEYFNPKHIAKQFLNQSE